MASGGDHDFELGETLGEGAFGKVYLCFDRNERNKKYAMKVIDLTKSTDDERELAEKEASLLTDLQHEFILHAVTSFQEKGALCIVTEFCDQGDLSQFLERRCGKSLDEQRIVEWFRQICSALQYLHSRNVLHRDMKTQNVFLTGEDMTAKLGDLGLAKVLERPTAKAVTFCGSPYYMSPEIFACKPYDSKSDIWAMGVCVYEMATLERPFDATLMQQLVFKIVHGQLPPMPKDKYSPQLINLMERMMCRETDKRPSATDLLNDVLFKNHEKPKAPPSLPQGKGAGGLSMRGSAILISALNQSRANKFDMGGLMETLNEKANQEKKKKKPKAANADKYTSIIHTANVSDKFLASNYEDMEKTVTDKTMKKGLHEKGKFAKNLPPKSSMTSVSDISLEDDDFESTMKADQARAALPPPPDPLQMMNLVVRTLTQVFPKDGQGGSEGALSIPDSTKMDPESMLLYQIEQLQKHCCAVLGYQLFARAYDLLDQTDDNMKLEEKLIRLLTPEKFAVVGVQLFYCKNFEYNLNKLKEGGGHSDA
ncbi:serine/threonine-protein kinase Nek3-like [Saccostrea echinata]|uniref:serine/threonine-protein kinase Nek3-like n=1 Tax=Saccostrea echinata TaxID=191078 RepID=UPI002A83B4E4|nr:serine/threonine-protein kinase Nek3-like [Saccostrea echinata]